jgi:ferritin-like metal-binding protein YciE
MPVKSIEDSRKRAGPDIRQIAVKNLVRSSGGSPGRRALRMSRYGTLRTWAEELGMPDAVALWEATLKEEKALTLP